MDVKVFSSGSAGLSSPVTALPAVANDTRDVLSAIGSSTGLNDSVRTELVQAVAAIDSGISSPTLRNDVLQQVASLGFYLNTTSDESMPRWSVLTGLRLYGLNLKAEAAASSSAAQAASDRQVAALVTDKLKSLAAGKGVSLDHVMAAVGKMKSAPAVTPAGEGTRTGSSGDGKGKLVEMVA